MHRDPLTPCVLFFFLASGGKASGTGQAGLPQHAQEVDGMSAGPAGRRRGQEVGQVAVGEFQALRPQEVRGQKGGGKVEITHMKVGSMWFKKIN